MVESEVVDERWVRNPGGRRELRPVIETTVRIGAARWPIELTLSRRDEMGFRMLLGRRALRGRALVDPGRSFRAARRAKPPTTKRAKVGGKHREPPRRPGSGSPEGPR